MFLPWANFWETHYLVVHYPSLRPYLLHPALRGAVSGLGALDILIAAGRIRQRPRSASNTAPAPQTRQA